MPQDITTRKRSSWLGWIFFLLAFFPYINPLAFITGKTTYIQPYFLVFSIFVFFVIFSPGKKISRVDLLGGCFLLFCILIFLFFPITSESVVALVGPVTFFLASYCGRHFYTRNAEQLRSVLRVSCWLFLIVGVVQLTISPSFMTFALGGWGEGILGEGGRGAVSLFPEPTHYGLSCILLIGLCILSGVSRFYIFLFLLQLVFISQSSTAIGLGVVVLCVYFAFQKPALFLKWIPFCFVFGYVLFQLVRYALPESRAVWFIDIVIDEPSLFIVSDTSANIRVLSIWFSLLASFENYFIPHGFSMETWRDIVLVYSSRFAEYYIHVSDTRIQSGLGALFFQFGASTFILLATFISAYLSSSLESEKKKFVIVSLIVVMLNAFPLATPIFGLMVGILPVSDKGRCVK